ncbi:hypothetical protein V8G54_028726 [Vigna mungo]|uniref:Uncharacterized protein n=1 Tax=Vigna mungo TaxID=3915 RepID=A0AAQ3MSY0_VIGMU
MTEAPQGMTEEDDGRVEVTDNMCEMINDVFAYHYSNNDMVDDDEMGPPNEAGLHSPPQLGGNSHVQDEHEEDENQDILLQVQQERPLTCKRLWLVDVIGKTLCTY